LSEFIERVHLQKPTNERITMDRVTEAIRSLTMEQSIVEQAGPALNSGRAILLYGPPGNGKTSVALCFNSVYQDVIHVPYAIVVEGQIIRFYDPRIHVQASPTKKYESPDIANFKRDTYDRRWVSCRRPFVVAGGELTLDMLDLRYDPVGQYYEAPLHMKALGGCFLIDDFGRQFVSPRDLLNRWIVPMESRVDYMKLRSGASFSIPFEEVVIFATNLDPEDLMDPAFLRRLPYKIEVGPPNIDQFRRIFEQNCAERGMTLTDEVFNFIVYMITKEKGLELAGFQPTFIIDQVTATCRFLGKDPELKSPYIEYAVNNLRVKRNPQPRTERVVHPDAPATTAAARVSSDDFDRFPALKVNPA
jgi:energy-coupling factor transporter ATP-binding protein EcfA2